MDISNIYIYLGREVTNFYQSPVFSVIKFLLAVYVIVLLIDIVLLLFQRGLSGNLRQIVAGMDLPPELTTKKKKFKGQWEKIKSRLDSQNDSEYKVAVIEADNIIDDIISRLGYKGENLGERLANIPAGQLEHLDEIKGAHEVRNRIIHEEDFSISRAEAQKIIEKYEHFLRHFEVLD